MVTHSHTSLSCPEQWVQPHLIVQDAGHQLVFTPEDVFRYHGYDAVGGAVLGFRLLQRAIRELSPQAMPERRDISLFTAFPGLGARDCFELVTRMASERRLTLDTSFTHKDAQKELLTEEAVELLTTPLDLAQFKTAISEALFKGTKRNVVSEDDGSKNAVVG